MIFRESGKFSLRQLERAEQHGGVKEIAEKRIAEKRQCHCITLDKPGAAEWIQQSLRPHAEIRDDEKNEGRRKCLLQ